MFVVSFVAAHALGCIAQSRLSWRRLDGFATWRDATRVAELLGKDGCRLWRSALKYVGLPDLALSCV
jgi:hypothetical protein